MRIERLGEAGVREMARDVVTNRGMLTDDPEAIKCAFMLMRTFTKWSDVENLDELGAFYGPYSDTTGQALNGYPIFTSMRLVHRDDCDALNGTIGAMQAALA